MTHTEDRGRCLEVLGLGPNASEAEIETAYRDMVKVWHPDRFQADPRLRLKAEEKLKELNDAYQRFRQPRAPRPDRPRSEQAESRSDSGRSEYSAAPSQLGSSRESDTRTFVNVSLAVAAVVGVLLLIGGRRGTSQSADQVLPDPSRAVRPVASRPGEPQTSEPAPSAPTTGTLAVFSQPSGATVYFNDQAVGQTPLNLTALAPGEHRVRLELDDRPAWSSAVRIEAGKGEKLLAIFEKQAQ